MSIKNTAEALIAGWQAVDPAQMTWDERAGLECAEALLRREEQIATLFDRIKHGDEMHRAWLRSEIELHFANGIGNAR